MSKTKLIRTAAAEEAAIQRGIEADSDNPEWTADDFSKARPFAEVMQKRMGRPPKENPKEQVTMRYDADVLEAFRATGSGWQTRMNDALKTYLKEHPLKAA
jgi:uncharacterized protein (DUF4415 family)